MIKKIRIILSSMFAAAVCAAMLPAMAMADDSLVNVTFDKTSDSTVAVSVENAGGISESVSALQLTIGVEVESGSMDGIDVSFAFSDSFDATIKEAMPFNRESNMINIYVAGGKDLLASKLDLGTLTFTANQSADAKLKVVVAGLEEGDGTSGLQVVGAARNTMNGYTVQSNDAEMVFQPQQITTRPGDIPNTSNTADTVDKSNTSPIVPTPMNSSTETPQTGDNLLPIIVTICVVAVLAVAVAFVSSRRSKKENDR